MAIINKTGITNGGTIQAEHITRVIDALSGVSTDSLVLTGSMTGSLKGSLTGTSSFASSALSSSFAVTASYALNASAGAGFPYTGNAVITGSLTVSGSAGLTVVGTTNMYGEAGDTYWTATKYSTIDWRAAGEGGFDGQLLLPLQAPNSPRTGAIYFNADIKSLFIYDGSGWKEFQPIP